MSGELILLAAHSDDDMNGWSALVLIAFFVLVGFVCWVAFRD